MIASVAATITSIALILVSVLLIGLVLLQKNRGSGLSGAFGGVGGHSAFGTRTGDVMTWITVGLATVFLLLAIVNNYFFHPDAMAGGTSPAATAAPVGRQPPATPAQQTPSEPASDAPAAPSGG
jgi:preprotein translocase subunit SecG